MGLVLYNSEQVALGMNGAGQLDDPLRTKHEGKRGGADQLLLYLRNNASNRYYHDVVVTYVPDVGIDSGPLGNTGWSIKLAAGERQPTEVEWDAVTAGEPLAMPDIGTDVLADTSTYYPFWVRVYCPGETPAQLRVGQQLVISFLEEVV